MFESIITTMRSNKALGPGASGMFGSSKRSVRPWGQECGGVRSIRSVGSSDRSNNAPRNIAPRNSIHK